MNELNEKEQIMREYWLGALSDEQTEFFETDWFSNNDDAELLEIARADLMDDYLTDNLTGTERPLFEKNFLPDNLEDLILAKSSLEISREALAPPGEKKVFVGFWDNIRNFIGIPQIAAAGLLLVCCGLLFKFYYIDPSQQIARNNEPGIDLPNDARTDSEKVPNPGDKAAKEKKEEALIAENEAQNANSKIQKESDDTSNSSAVRNLNTVKNQSNESKREEKRQVVFLAFFRGGEGVKTVKLAEQKDSLTLKLTMPGIDKAYQNYELKIYDANNNVVAREVLGSKLSLKKSGEIITTTPLKGSLFRKNNTYKTSLVGIDENGKEQELVNYDSFRIE